MQIFNMTRSIPQQDRERELQKIEDGALTKLNSKCNPKYLKGSPRSFRLLKGKNNWCIFKETYPKLQIKGVLKFLD